MKFVVLTLLLSVVCCSYSFYHYNGTIQMGEEVQNITGSIIVEISNKMNMTYMTGMVDGPYHHHHSFEVAGKITNYSKYSNDTLYITGAYVEGRIGSRRIYELDGKFNVTIIKNVIFYKGNGTEKSGSHYFALDCSGYYSACPYYKMKEAAARAALLIGESSQEYKPTDVINYAVLGYPYIRNANTTFYHKYFGELAKITAPGVIIVGNDFKHIAIVDKEGDKFIHSIPERNTILATPIGQIRTYFPNGYVLKGYNLSLIHI
eukprot:TRINITY_DN2559_c0_g1_i9.p1 TRINITY_DN2559_c0_g1~~TRINITY_DN2559_c0_g1_i9.p1  ORF type:complete len:262 (-),score=24.95 TRINITY_DN2559_c0_g1_i9:170-955(-)